MDKKALSLPILTSLVVGNMIGTGIYMLPASLAAFGSNALIAWVFTSIGALFLALAFAHLNKRYPKTGGPIIYAKQAYGRLIGFIVAYTYWIANLVSIAGIAVAATGYLGFIFPVFNSNTAEYNQFATLGLELGLVWLFTLINIIGVHAAGLVQLILTIAKVIPLVVISLIGLFFIHPEYFSFSGGTLSSNFNAISSAAALTFWSFIGLESATVPAENTKGPKDIYKATVYGTLITGIVYILSTFVLMGMIPTSDLGSSQFPFANAGTLLFGTHAAMFITLCAVLSGLGTLNGCILLQGQIVFAAAREHYFPKRFTKLTKHDVPYAGQILSSALISVLLITTINPTLLKQFNSIALLAALLTLITYFICALAEIKFSFTEKRQRRYALLTRSMLIAILASVYAVWMISSFSKETLIAGLAIFGLAVPIYFAAFKKAPVT